VKEKTKFYIIIVLTIILLGVSIIIRIPKESELYNNSDATYHTLLTMKCYDETPISVHKFLPIVSLGNEEDKNISWGACQPDKYENYYYTSFSSAGFALPYIFVKVLNLPINIYSLYAFNSIIYIATFILMTIIFCKLFQKYISKNLIIIFTALIYLFQIEVMQSQGFVYWVQSVMQLLLAVQFLLFMNFENKKAKIVFFVMCLIMPYVEWTGYVSNVAFAIILFIKDIVHNKKITKESFIEPVIIGCLTILSFFMFSMHFLLNLELEEYILALKNRFLARNWSASRVRITDLLKGYFISYKYIIILLFVLLLIMLSLKKYRKKLWELVKEYKYELIFFAFILFENFIMLEHAVSYTFDRLKFTYILITLFFIIYCTISKMCDEKNKKFIMYLGILLFSIIAIINIKDYKNGYNKYVTENEFESNNQIIASYIKENFNYSNSVLCCNRTVRGYLNLLLDRGIYELKSYDSAWITALDNRKQFLVYLNTENQTSIKEVIIENIQDNSAYKVYVNENELVREDINIY